VTITATVSPNPGNGYVAFTDEYRALGSAALNNGKATIVTSFVTGGRHRVRAAFRGNSTHLLSISTDALVEVQAIVPQSTGATKQFEFAFPVLADVNGDGRVDLVRFTQSIVVVELMQANGSYGTAIPYNIGLDRTPVGVADFNSDGRTDVAAIERENLVVISGNGSAGFTQTVLATTPIGSFPVWSLGYGPTSASGDFNRDGAADLALSTFSFSSYNGPTMTILFGDGKGQFTIVGGMSDPKGAIGDANGDGILDFASDLWFRGTVLFYKMGCRLLVSNGGSYVDGDDCGATDVGTLRAGDLNADGKPDLLFNGLIRLGTGAGSFLAATPIDFGPEFTFIDLFDLNGDGNLDAIGSTQGLLAAKLGNGRGGFPSSTTVAADAASFSTFQDVNGDGVLDFVYSDHLTFGSTQSAPVVESVSIAPVVRSGSNQTITLVIRDNEGASSLKTVILNLDGGEAKTCRVTIDVNGKTASLDQLELFTEGSGWQRNPYCAINPQGITIQAADATLTVAIPLVFQANAEGTVFVTARGIDSSGGDSLFKAFGTTTVTHTNRLPQAVSVTASGQNPTIFTVTMNDPDGLSNFATAELLIGESLSTANACYIAIDPQSRVVRLMTDSGVDWLGAYMISNRYMVNSQCATNSNAFEYVSTTGQQITFKIPVDFNTFHGAKNLYLRAIDFSGGDSGFQLRGQIQLSAVAPQGPSVTDLQPRTGSNQNVTLTGQFRHPNGANGHYLGYILILPTPNVVQFTAAGSCLVEYNRISNGVRLINDAGNDWLGPISGVVISPHAIKLSNSRCSVDVSKAVASINGQVLTFTAPIQLTSAMSPVAATFIQSLDVTGKWTGMTQFGNWLNPAGTQTNSGPRVASLSFTRADENSVNVRIGYSHSTSLAKIDLIHLRITDTISSDKYCHIVYSPNGRALNLIDDSGTILLGWRTVNTGGLINSRCTVHTYDLVNAFSNGNGYVSFSVERTPGNLPANLKFYVNAFDTDARLTHWVDGGFWQ